MTGTGLGVWERDRLLEPLDSYQRGLSDVPLLHKWTECQAGPVESEGDLPIAFVISTDGVDLHDDVIQAQGWQLDAYLNNPVFLKANLARRWAGVAALGIVALTSVELYALSQGINGTALTASLSASAGLGGAGIGRFLK